MTFLFSFASTTIIVSAAIILILIATPVLDKKFAAGGRYFLWIVIIAALLFMPFASLVPRPTLEISVPIAIEQVQLSPPETIPINIPSLENPAWVGDAVPNYNVGEFQPPAENGITTNAPQQVEILAEIEAPPLQWNYMVLIVWLFGVTASLAFHIIKHFHFVRFVKRWGFDAEDVIFVHKKIRIMRCKGINSPMLIGFARPKILLPTVKYKKDELELILRHELIHFKRKDLWFKLALVAIRSMHWFNPAVHLMSRQASKDIEIICDTMTTKGLDINARKNYSELILSMVNGKIKHGAALTTGMNGGKKMLKQRFLNIFSNGKKKGIVLFSLIAVAIAATTFFIGINFAVDEINGNVIEHDVQNDSSYHENEDTMIYESYDYSGTAQALDNIALFIIGHTGNHDLLRRDVRSYWGRSFGDLFATRIYEDVSLEIELTSRNIVIGTKDDSIQVNRDNGILFTSNGAGPNSLTQDGNSFLMVDHPEFINLDNASMDIHLSPNRNFVDLDIYVEYGEVLISDVTITGHLRVTIINGSVSLINVNVDRSKVEINGEPMPASNSSAASTSQNNIANALMLFDISRYTQNPLVIGNGAVADGTLYSESISTLQGLVFDEPRLVERTLHPLNLSGLNINTSFDNVRFVQGDRDDRITIRYYEWVEGQYTLNEFGGIWTLTMENMPRHKIMLANAPTTFDSFEGMLISGGGMTSVYSITWLPNYISERGQNINNVIEIIVPPNFEIGHINISTPTGWIDAANIGVSRHASLSSGSGNIIVDGAHFMGMVNFSVGSGWIVGNAATFRSTANISAGTGQINFQNSRFFATANLSVGSGELRSANNQFSGTANFSTGTGQMSSDNDSFNTLNMSTASGESTIILAQNVNNYNIQKSTVTGEFFHNGNQIRAQDLRNASASTRINLSSSSGIFKIFDR